ncbi:hypothetical protein [Larkinella soli]|uniref:hypothetical protein n=1 Tax=Larkinella soli TaxID=1770527 RepID=UPI0013E30E30|nr:hypothetical protein [Larkinella soli]
MFLSLSACRQERKISRTDKNPIAVFTKQDTTFILQAILDHRPLDSLLSFAFKGRQLKIVKDSIITSNLPLIKNNKPVLFVEVDSTNDELRRWYDPKFFMRVTKLVFKSASEVEGVVYFKAIGLLCVYKLSKDDVRSWKIFYYHFYST